MDHIIVYYLMLAATILFALQRGSITEKQGALTALAGSILTSTAANSESWANLDLSLLAIDLAVLASFWRLALISNRFWPYWVVGWQLVTVFVHLQRGMFENILPEPYALLAMYLAYPILLLILAASLYGDAEEDISAH